MNVGSILKYYRMKNNLTQAELCDGICSVSHLSKIESNKYIPHSETLNELFNRMGIEWQQEMDIYEMWNAKLETFISYSVYYDLKSMETLYEELDKNEEYFQSTDLVNRYELYKLRFYLFKQDVRRAKQQTTILKRLEPSFNDYEKNVSEVIYLMYDIFSQNIESAEKRLEQIRESKERIPYLFEGELFYQKAYLLHMRTLYEESSYYAELAVDHYKQTCNYIRLLHAQILLAINYTHRDFILQADDLFKIVLRNSKMMEIDSLYQGALYNYSVLQNRRGLHHSAHELLSELKSIVEPDTDYYKSVLIHLLHTSVEAEMDISSLLAHLEEANDRKKDPYTTIQITYFRKMKLSQQELLDYCEQTAFPFFVKHGYIGEARSIAWKLANYHRSLGNYEKADEFSLYHFVKGDEKS
ncbi:MULTISPECIES: helix-turn-helix transcriptional regulator [Sporosarcina]|uniref:Helix-turn-helix domain-containing protein n=1 Tax=Sporosarcina contaminans TaxID=633403 RepID=A0ABW3TZQ6_9BACL